MTNLKRVLKKYLQLKHLNVKLSKQPNEKLQIRVSNIFILGSVFIFVNLMNLKNS